MSNLVQWIKAEANGEDILGVVVGDPQHYGLGEKDKAAGRAYGKLVTWAEAKAWLDYEFDDGYGGAECHPVTAWTASKVMFVCEYDGSTRMASVPRNPMDSDPEYM
jgi:hypothetical protein